MGAACCQSTHPMVSSILEEAPTAELMTVSQATFMLTLALPSSEA